MLLLRCHGQGLDNFHSHVVQHNIWCNSVGQRMYITCLKGLVLVAVPCVPQVVWDDSIMRLFVVPTAAHALGLVFRAIKGQVDFETPVGECGTLGVPRSST